MKEFYLVITVCLFLQLNAFAQFDFSVDNPQLSIFSEQSIDAININLDSLMLDSIITDYYNLNHIPGLATLITKDNQIIWNKNYGYRNLEQQLPVVDSTFFYTASISKTILATAVMQLWENGMINLEDNINNYLPTGFTVVNPYHPSDPITVKMLLVHTSSLQDNYPVLDSLASCGDSPIPLDTFLINYFTPGGMYNYPNNFYNAPPGQQFNYSNTGASLLALMVENITDKSFDEYCRDSIFIPLSMNSTSWFLEGMDTTKIAAPYIDPSHPICHQGIPFYPAGTLRTNKLELSNFLSAYLNNGVFNTSRILKSTTIEFMLSDQLGYTIEGVLVQGLLWYKILIYNGNVWGHYGAAPGAQTFAGLDTLEKYSVVWFQNWNEGESLKLVEANFYFTRYAYLYGHIYALKPTINKSYARKNIDSVLFRTEFSNIHNHPFTSHLIYTNPDSTIIDSLTLFDDGLHGDSLSNDGIYGAYLPPQQTENFFYLGTSTIDNQNGKYFNTPDICRFATAGPVILNNVVCSIDSPGYSLTPFLKNQSTVTTITNVWVRLICNDPWITSITPNSRPLPRIPPGNIVSPTSAFTVNVDSTFPGYFNFKFEIMSDGYTYWRDSIRIVTSVRDKHEMKPLRFSLKQNYPNPFNPRTKISWQTPVGGKQTLKVFDILGREVATLVNEYKPAGKYEIEFNASNLPSGIYFYRLRSGSFVESKKMILLK